MPLKLIFLPYLSIFFAPIVQNLIKNEHKILKFMLEPSTRTYAKFDIALSLFFQVSSADRGHSPNPLGLRRLKDENLASSSLSLPPESNGSRPSVLSAFSYDMRSKTDNLDRLINEVERSSADNLTAGSGREVKKYIRRRYTDSRHPTTELPDVRGDPLPSVQDPPLRKSRSKQNIGSSSQILTGTNLN